MDDLRCDGTESSLATCSYRGCGSSNCGHQEDAGVNCKVKVVDPSLYCDEESQICLADGSMTSGRVEICHDHEWGNII